MICKERSIGGAGAGADGSSEGSSTMRQTTTVGVAPNRHCNTLQNRRKSQLITFSGSSCDIKNSLSHEIILVSSSQYNNNNNNSHKSAEMGSFGVGAGSGIASLSGRASIASNSNNYSGRLSYAEEEMLMVNKSADAASGSGSGSGSASASGSAESGHEADLEDDVFRRRSLEGEDDDDDDDEEAGFDDGDDDEDEFGTRIEISNNANDDSGGGSGSYEDSHALQSSIGGSNRNSLEKDYDEIDVDVISTDVSCYDQLLGSSCNTRNDDDMASSMGEADCYAKLCKNNSVGRLNGGGLRVVHAGGGSSAGSSGSSCGGGSGSGGGGENCGLIYANPFLDDEGIAESGM